MKALLQLRTYKLSVTAIFIIFFWGNAFTQNQNMLNFNYNLCFPIGLENDIGNISEKGFSVEARTFISDQVTVGGVLGWNYFYKDYGSITDEYETLARDEILLETNTITGYKRKSTNIIPMMFSTHFYLFKKRKIKPYRLRVVDPGVITAYIGFNFGGYYTTSSETMGNSSALQTKSVSLGLAPEAGFLFMFGKSNTGVNFSLKYNFKSKTIDNPSSSWLEINLGFSHSF